MDHIVNNIPLYPPGVMEYPFVRRNSEPGRSDMTHAAGNRGVWLAKSWTPGRFLLTGGIVLLVLGLAGLAGALGSVSTMSLFNPPYWVNWLHTAAGSLLIALALKAHSNVKLAIAMFGCVAGTTIGTVGLLFNKPALPDLSDHLTHLAVGLLAAWAVWNHFFNGPHHLERTRLGV
jgi:hypothetical protein